jgi:hypothetical protein
MNPKNHAPAIKYPQLALAEPDKAEAHIPRLHRRFRKELLL